MRALEALQLPEIAKFPVRRCAVFCMLGIFVLLASSRVQAGDGELVPCDPKAVEKWAKPKKAEISRLRRLADLTIRDLPGFTPKSLTDSCTAKLIGFLGPGAAWGAAETADLEKAANCLELQLYEREMKCVCARHGMKYSAEGYKFMKEWEGVYAKGPKGYLKLIDERFKPGGYKLSEYAAVPKAAKELAGEDFAPEGVRELRKKMKEFEGVKKDPVTLNPVIEAWIKRASEVRKCFDENTLATIHNVSAKLEGIDLKEYPDIPSDSMPFPSIRFDARTIPAPPPGAPHRAARTPGYGVDEKGLIRGKSEVTKSDITGIPEDRAKREMGPGAKTVEDILFKPTKPEEKPPAEPKRVGGVKVDVHSKGKEEDLSAERDEILKMRKRQ